jgi:RNA polymerase sigma-70 factor, ECF subfamily
MGTYIATVSPLEDQLMARIRTRDESAFEELFLHFGNRIYRTALRILKEEQSAEDALQETFMNVYRASNRFRGESKVGTWINRITVNVCLEMLRRNKKYSQRAETDISEQIDMPDMHRADPFQQLHQREVATKVQRALQSLSRKHRLVVRMHDLEGHTIKEIANRLGVAEGTVKSRLFYGREELKKRLKAAA